MPCCFAVFAGLFPRFGTIILWLARPTMFNAAFNGSWILPVLGIIFLPFATLMYAVLWGFGGRISGLDWLWIALAVLIDLGHWATNAYQNRNRIPGYASQ
jgi:hypothetical protein